MVASDFENIRFQDNSSSKVVPTVFGASSSETVILTYDDPIFGNQEVSVALPGGIGSSNQVLFQWHFYKQVFRP